MSNLTFDYVSAIKVKLNGKRIGTIKEVTGGWAFFPKGSKDHGDVLASQFAIIASLKSE